MMDSPGKIGGGGDAGLGDYLKSALLQFGELVKFLFAQVVVPSYEPIPGAPDLVRANCDEVEATRGQIACATTLTGFMPDLSQTIPRCTACPPPPPPEESPFSRTSSRAWRRVHPTELQSVEFLVSTQAFLNFEDEPP